jgi:hypothetical protein
MRHFSTVWLLSIVLAACGGGGGSPSAPPTSSTPTPQQVAAARSAKLTATLDGSWSSLDAVPGTTGTGAALTWTRTINSAATLRVLVPETGYSVPLDTPSGNNSVMVAPPTTIPSIALSQAQPVSGNVTLSIAGGSTYSAARRGPFILI